MIGRNEGFIMIKRMQLSFVFIFLLSIQAQAQLPLIIGPHMNALDKLPATVRVLTNDGNGLCTAAKVAKSIYLTAAHCLEGIKVGERLTIGINRRSIMASLIKGSMLGNLIQRASESTYSDLINDFYISSVDAKFKKIVLHPDYRANEFDSADIALFKIDREIPEVKAARILLYRDIEMLKDERLLLNGYGISCEEKNCFKNLYVYSQLKKKIKMGAATSKEIELTLYLETILKPIEQLSYFRSDVVNLDKTHGYIQLYNRETTIAPGDSGGPVYLELNTGEKVIVGVNASIFFSTDKNNKIIVINSILTTFNNQSSQIADWLDNYINFGGMN